MQDTNKKSKNVKLLDILTELRNWIFTITIFVEVFLLGFTNLNILSNQENLLITIVINLIIIILFSLATAYKYLTYTNPPLIDFSPYIDSITNLTNVNFFDYRETKPYYVSLSGSELMMEKFDITDFKFDKFELMSIRANDSNQIHEGFILKDHKLNQSLDKNLMKLIDDNNIQNPVLIYGSAGTGKSTLLKNLAYELAKKWKKVTN